jgi:hypothetical protein
VFIHDAAGHEVRELGEGFVEVDGCVAGGYVGGEAGAVGGGCGWRGGGVGGVDAGAVAGGCAGGFAWGGHGGLDGGSGETEKGYEIRRKSAESAGGKGKNKSGGVVLGCGWEAGKVEELGYWDGKWDAWGGFKKRRQVDKQVALSGKMEMFGRKEGL